MQEQTAQKGLILWNRNHAIWATVEAAAELVQMTELLRADHHGLRCADAEDASASTSATWTGAHAG